MPHSPRFSVIAGVAVACGIALAPALASAQSADWRALRIDGSSPERFQASIAALQNVLPARARDDFETALAAIWISNSTTADVDEDGFLEVADVGELRRYSEELLADIHRGDVVVAIEELDVSGDEYSTADYFEQLDGLGYEAVLDLAGLTDESPEEGVALRAYKAQLLCRDPSELTSGLTFGEVRAKWCDRFFRSKAATPVPLVPVGAALSTAKQALDAGDTATAEAAIDALHLDQLTPFERGMAEMLMFNVKYRQRLFPEARQHLQAAVDVQIMSQADADAIVGVIEHFERMAAPSGPRIDSPGVEQDPSRREVSRDPGSLVR